MIHIPNREYEAAMNLAMEEYILTSGMYREEVLFFYVNDPSIIIGRHQNTSEEINAAFVSENRIQVVRRLSGGGAVYHDRGNLNYSLILPGASASVDFSILLTPIVGCLRELGLNAEPSGRNDITFEGRKFSGNAYYHNNAGSVIHGTLLFDSDLTVLAKALKPKPEKYLSKGVKSVRSRVCCIKELLPEIGSVEELESAIVDHFSRTNKLREEHFSQEDLERIQTIADQRYRNDSWNYGASPAFNQKVLIRIPEGTVDFRAVVTDGTIQNARFFGDFFSPGDIPALESSLAGTAWDKKAIGQNLADGLWHSCFPAFPPDKFISSLPL